MINLHKPPHQAHQAHHVDKQSMYVALQISSYILIFSVLTAFPTTNDLIVAAINVTMCQTCYIRMSNNCGTVSYICILRNPPG